MTAAFFTRTVQFLATPLIAGLVLAVLAPFGTDGFAVPVRVIYWVGLTLAGGLGATVARPLLLRARPQAGLFVRIFVQSGVATLAVAPFVLGLNHVGNAAGFGLSLFYIFVIAATITTVGELVNRQSEAPAVRQRPPLLERLPPKFRNATLYAISSEDHYIRIHSAAGEHMMLMRLTDAQDLAAPLSGLKPHRSWWVAEAGVAEIVRAGGRTGIILQDGTRVPVSRAGAKRLREAGWV